MARKVQAFYPHADYNFAYGGIEGRTFAWLFGQDAVRRRVHAHPVLFLANMIVNCFVILNALHEAFNGFILCVFGIFGQIGLAPDEGVEQERVLVHALRQKKHGMVF